MPEKKPKIVQLSDATYYHVTGGSIQNLHKPLMSGTILNIGEQHNPFYSFYETYERKYPINGRDYRAIRLLELVAAGHVALEDIRWFAGEATKIAKHFQMLSREFLLEEVRLKFAPDAPSRRTALWVVPNYDLAKLWYEKLGRENMRIAKLSLTGKAIEVDSALMVSDSERLSISYQNAERYWLGERSHNPEPETLFSGRAEVVAIINPSHSN